MIPYGIGERKGKSRKAAHQPWPLQSDGSEAPGPSQTGAFGPFRTPAVVGVSPDVMVANRHLARRARRSERRWTRSLPKGVK